jgi:hypothetical protein
MHDVRDVIMKARATIVGITLLLTFAISCDQVRVKMGQGARVQPSCYRNDDRGLFWVHVPMEYSYVNEQGEKHEVAQLVHINCGRSFGCKAHNTRIDKARLKFTDVGFTDVQFEEHRGSLSLLKWDRQTMTVRWDVGVVEVTDSGTSSLRVTYKPASCGTPTTVGQRSGNDVGLTWSFGESL